MTAHRQALGRSPFSLRNLLVASILFYLVLVVMYVAWVNHREKQEVLAEVDQPLYHDVTDRLGIFRHAYIVRTAGQGDNRFILAADIDRATARAAVRRRTTQAVLFALVFSMAAVPFIVLCAVMYRDHLRELRGKKHILALARDMTEKKRAEDEMKCLNRRLRLAQESAGFGVWDLDWTHDVLVWDDKMHEIYGTDPGDFQGNCEAWRHGVHPDDIDRADREVRDAIRDGDYPPTEFRVLRPNGEVRHVKAFGVVIKDEDGETKRMIGINFDITEQRRFEAERKSMEAHLHQAQRLESIGTLAGGVAHEINNPISGIMNYAQLIKDRIEGIDDTACEFAESIIEESRRVGKLTRGLLNFAHATPARYGANSLADIIENTLALVRTVMRHDGIDLDVYVPEDLPQVLCRTQQIQQVLMNLLTNARDALNAKFQRGDAGKVVRLTARELSDESGYFVRLTVEDRGVGIAETELDIVFDPFYTTKRPGNGVGLGLSISHSIVKDYGGRLTVESEPGQWTRFHLDLPMA